MNLLACILLILSALILMVKYGAGPFSKLPWYTIHSRFLNLHRYLQNILFYSALILSLFSSLILMGWLDIN